jgi:hypothetical protein
MEGIGNLPIEVNQGVEASHLRLTEEVFACDRGFERVGRTRYA